MSIKVLLLNDSREAGGAESVFNASYELLSSDLRFEVDRLDGSELGAPHFIWNNKAWNLRACRVLAERIRATRPDVVWVHNFHGRLSASIFWTLNQIRRTSRCRVVVTMHDYQLVGFNPTLMTYRGDRHKDSVPLRHIGSWRAWLYRSTPKPLYVDAARKMYWTIARQLSSWMRAIDAVFCPSPLMTEAARACGLPRPLLVRQPSFLGGDPVRREPVAVNRGLRLLYLGRVAPEKGWERFFSLLAASDFDGVETVEVVGGGADLDALRRWVRDEGFEHRVLIRGHVSRDRAVEEIRRNDAVIVSSVCYENAPMVIVEAAHYGTPSLVRAYGSLETFADDLGSKVLWHDDGTPEALSEALDALREKLRSGETYQTEPYSNQAYLETIHREFSNLVSAGE